MKIGMLTFHSQLNYGGVLQCWALKTALEKLGHEVVVVDRWWNKDNRRLRGDFWVLSHRRRLGYLRYALRAANGEFGTFIRRLRTMLFIRHRLNLTSYGFHDWKDAPRELGVDAIVVGSDQVWRIGSWDDPAPYLLEFRDDVRKFSYAASFGMSELPEDSLARYKVALEKFAAVSCREHEGVAICKRMGINATQVADPTLLIDIPDYGVRVGRDKNVLVCYFLSQDPIPVLPILEDFALRNSCEVVLLTIEDRRISKKGLRKVTFAASAGPKEFLRYLAMARWVVTDSFHGLMFSAIFNRNVRILRPADPIRLAMFARIDEFVRACVQGNAVCQNVSSALQSLERDPRIEYRRDSIEEMRRDSLRWIAENVK